MKRTICSSLVLLLLISSLTFAQEVSVKEGEKETMISNKNFVFYLSKDRGWLLDKVERRNGEVLLGKFHIYTDKGIYPVGYISSLNEKEGNLSIEKEGEKIIAIAEGELKAQDGKRMTEPIKYKVTYKIGKEASLEVTVQLIPKVKPREVRGFLAQVLTVFSPQQWLVNSVDGIISGDMKNATIKERCWQSRKEPLNLDNPFIGVLLAKGGSLCLKEICCQPSADNIFLYVASNGLEVFFAFMDGYLPEIGQPLQVHYIIDFDKLIMTGT